MLRASAMAVSVSLTPGQRATIRLSTDIDGSCFATAKLGGAQPSSALTNVSRWHLFVSNADAPETG